MGMSYNTGTANAIIAGTVTAVAEKRQCKFLRAEKYNSSGTANIGTVPTGKVWRIIGLYVTLGSGIAGSSVATITLNSEVIIDTRTYGTTSNTTNISLSYENAVIATAGQTLVYNQGGTGSGAGGIFYIEEDA